MQKKLIILFIMLPLILGVIFCNDRAYASDFTRLAGKNRFDTAVSISKAGWTTSDYAIVATGENFPDALSATPLSSFYNAPILLTERDSLTLETKTELQRLKVKNVFIVGGPGVVTDKVKNLIEGITYLGQTSPVTVTRISGKDRYSTSVEVAKLLGSFNEVVIATGSSFPDALSIAPVAAIKRIPILLVSRDSISDSVVQFLNGKNINKTYVIGGTGAISDEIKNKFNNPERISGTDRFETNINILNRFETELNFSDMFVATGINFPDALAGSALAAKKSSGIILIGSTVPKATRNFSYNNSDRLANLYILGGQGVVPYEAAHDLMISPKAGNTSANIANGGNAVIRDNYLYYNDMWHGETITKQKLDGTGRKFFYTNKIENLNVTDKYIFFIDNVYDNKIGRMNTDGSGLTRLKYSASQLHIFDNYIYYTNLYGNSNLYRVNFDGSGQTLLADDNNIRNVNITENYIYYTSSGVDGNRNLYRINRGGGGKTLIRAGWHEFVIVWGDSIYFVDRFDGYKIVKIKLDGTGYQKLNEDISADLNIFGDIIYYSNGSDGAKLYSIKTNGTQRRIITDNQAYLPNIAGNTIYYLDNNLSGIQKTVKAVEPTPQQDPGQNTIGNIPGNLVNGAFTATDGKYLYIKNTLNGAIYRYNPDGSGEKFICDYDAIHQLNVVGDWLYYLNDNHYIVKIRSDGSGQKTVISTDKAYSLIVVGDWIYYTVEYNDYSQGYCYSIYKIRTDGTGKQGLEYYDSAKSLNIAGDWLYYVNNKDNNCIYKIRTDGTGRTKISSAQARNINVIGNTIYFISYIPNEGSGYIMKMNTDGSNLVNLNAYANSFIATENSIYYDTFSDKKFYKMDVDGSNVTYIMDLPKLTYTINILGDTPYFSPYIEGYEY